MTHNKITVSRLGTPDVVVADRAAARTLIRKRGGLIGSWSQWRDAEHYGTAIRYRRARWYTSHAAKAADHYEGVIVEVQER